jgi:hypothetical protein
MPALRTRRGQQGKTSSVAFSNLMDEAEGRLGRGKKVVLKFT